MASVEYQNSILWRGEDPSKRKFKPRYDNSHKVERYFPGQAPRWAKSRDEEEPGEEAAAFAPPSKRKKAQVDDVAAARLKRLAQTYISPEERRQTKRRHRAVGEAEVLEENDEDEVEKDEKAEKDKFVKKEDDSDAEEEDDEKNLAILQGLLGAEAEGKAGAAADDSDDDLDVTRPETQAQVKEDVKEEEEEDEELAQLRRAQKREMALLKRQAEEANLKEEVVEEEVPDEEDSEYESESEEDPRSRTLMKPVFVPKNQRDTVKEKENMEKEEELKQEKEKEKKKERKVESKTMLIDTIKLEDEAEKVAEHNEASDVELPDDDDEKDEAEEYDLWKIRELKRIKRDREERLERQREIEFIERRRTMTDEERAAEDAKLDADATKREDSKNFGFLQKYYHRGGYFQDKARTGEEPLYLRDYHEPLEEEKYDKNLLPKAMQVRRGLFGKKGQVKHTHLTEVDTTDFSANWSQSNKMVQKYQEKMAGAKGVNDFTRPSARSSSGI
mmetsp:Transcript_66106/g.158150  ORF Transcript_66106/g.158150 Transcript_66106/m.158150 type:complete len:502 (+) Transcript_66106:83-1588(+)